MRQYIKKAIPKAPQDKRNLENTVRGMLDEIKEKKTMRYWRMQKIWISGPESLFK